MQIGKDGDGWNRAMKLFAISGSPRVASTNTAMLECFCPYAPVGVELSLYRGLADLPVFSPDLEGDHTPDVVAEFVSAVRQADGIILSSPEYVRAIPGGLKNAFDWLVSGEEIISKPVVLAHASHRGDDMLMSLRLVLATVSQQFNTELFLQFSLMSKSPEEVRQILRDEGNGLKISSRAGGTGANTVAILVSLLDESVGKCLS